MGMDSYLLPCPHLLSLGLLILIGLDACILIAQLVVNWCMFLGKSLIFWKCKKLNNVSKSSTKVEYCYMSIACSKIIWTCRLLANHGVHLKIPTRLHVDNISSIQIAYNPIFHKHTKAQRSGLPLYKELLQEGIVILSNVCFEH